jgi:DNA-binding response OmpR family regulator
MSEKRKVLVVEDDALVALELSERLADMGYAVLGPAMTLDEAERVIAEEAPAAALLDANVAGRSSVDLGVMLVERGVPIAFCTGYDRIANLPARLTAAPVLTKPITDADLDICLKKLLALD